jgi:hypothetical protein
VQAQNNMKHRLQDAFFELLYYRSLHGAVYEERLLRDCERTLSNATSINPRLESYLKQIVEQASAERNLKTKIDWLLDEIEEVGGRSLETEEKALLNQETEFENWLRDQAEHFDARFTALWSGETTISMTTYRPDDMHQRTVLSKDGEPSSEVICLTLQAAVTVVAKWPKADQDKARFKVTGKPYEYTWADLEAHVA